MLRWQFRQRRRRGLRVGGLKKSGGLGLRLGLGLGSKRRERGQDLRERLDRDPQLYRARCVSWYPGGGAGAVYRRCFVFVHHLVLPPTAAHPATLEPEPAPTSIVLPNAKDGTRLLVGDGAEEAEFGRGGGGGVEAGPGTGAGGRGKADVDGGGGVGGEDGAGEEEDDEVGEGGRGRDGDRVGGGREGVEGEAGARGEDEAEHLGGFFGGWFC